MLRRLCFKVILALGGVLCGAVATAATKPIEVKVVVVSMFEIGADTGDVAGEFQLWRERQKLDQRFPFAHSHDLYLNPKTGVLGMVTGMGSINSATAVMALGLDPRFDLSHAYWLVAGIAGVDPELGKAARGLGASGVRVFAEILLPLTLRGVIAGSTLVFVISIGFYITPALLGGGNTLTGDLGIRPFVMFGMAIGKGKSG